MNRATLQGYLFAGATTLCYASSSIITRVVVTEVSTPLVTALFTLLWGGIFLGLLLFPVIWREMKAVGKGRGLGLFAVSGILASLGVIANYSALRAAPVVVVAPVTAIQPLFVLILSYFFFRRWETITRSVVLGASLVVAGVILIGLSRG